MSRIIRSVILVCTLFFGNLTTVHAEEELTAEKIGEIALEVFQKYGVEAPYPTIYMAEPDHWSVEGTTIGRAVQFIDGSEVIFLQDDVVGQDKDVLIDLLDHEISHVQNWRLNGLEVSNAHPHGRAYRQICREHAARKASCNAYMRFN